MRDTPRTDVYEGTWATLWPNGVSIFEHARQLERELAAVTKERDELRERVEKLEIAIDKMDATIESLT